jgi:hypothetical protein
MASADDSPTTSYFCITQARCRLCQFTLSDDELVVCASKSMARSARISLPMTNAKKEPRIALDDDHVSCRFPFERYAASYGHKFDIKIHMCVMEECPSRTKTTVCFHAHCYRARAYAITGPFLSTTRYSFAPSISEERRRAQKLRQALNEKLPRACTWPQDPPCRVVALSSRVSRRRTRHLCYPGRD